MESFEKSSKESLCISACLSPHLSLLSLIHTYIHTHFLSAWSSTLLISLGHTQCSRFYCYGLLNSMMERPSWGWHLFCRPSQMDTCAKLTKADDFCRAEYICWKGQIDLGIIIVYFNVLVKAVGLFSTQYFICGCEAPVNCGEKGEWMSCFRVAPDFLGPWSLVGEDWRLH